MKLRKFIQRTMLIRRRSKRLTRARSLRIHDGIGLSQGIGVMQPSITESLHEGGLGGGAGALLDPVAGEEAEATACGLALVLTVEILGVEEGRGGGSDGGGGGGGGRSGDGDGSYICISFKIIGCL
jgi:hypothetical protein